MGGGRRDGMGPCFVILSEAKDLLSIRLARLVAAGNLALELTVDELEERIAPRIVNN